MASLKVAAVAWVDDHASMHPLVVGKVVVEVESAWVQEGKVSGVVEDAPLQVDVEDTKVVVGVAGMKFVVVVPNNNKK